jgi:hypothetical protein
MRIKKVESRSTGFTTKVLRDEGIQKSARVIAKDFRLFLSAFVSLW